MILTILYPISIQNALRMICQLLEETLKTHHIPFWLLEQKSVIGNVSFIWNVIILCMILITAIVLLKDRMPLNHLNSEMWLDQNIAVISLLLVISI